MGVIFTQLDKVILSKLIDLESYSHYMLASVVSGALYLIVAPVYSIAFSRFSAIVVAASPAEVLSSLRFYTRALAVILLPIAMMIAVLSREIIELWTGDKTLAESVGPIVSLLVSGAALNGVMSMPHALQLALGMTRVPLMINGVLMSVIVPLIILLSIKYGAVGGAVAWLIFNVFYVFLSAWLMHRKILDFGAGEWFFKDIILPVFLIASMGIISSMFYRQIDLTDAFKMMLAAAQLILMCALGIFWSQGLYAAIKNAFSGVFQDARKF
jgi:O-antigen/teichoic acid export membrane protein